MLRRNSGPSVAAAILVALASLASGASAQDAAPAAPAAQAQPVAPAVDPVVPPAQATAPVTLTDSNAAPAAAQQPASTPAPTQQVQAEPNATAPAARPSTPSASPAPSAPISPESATPAAPADAEAPAVPATGTEAPAAAPTPAAPSTPEAPAAGQPAAPTAEQAPATPAPAEQPAAENAVPVEPPEPQGVIDSLLPGLVGVPSENLPHDLSPMGMFMAADWVVKSVMIALALASLATWTIWVAKTLQISGAKMRATKGIKVVTQARTLDAAVQEMKGRGGVVANMVRFADQEARLSDAAIDHAGGDGLKERVSSALSRIEVQAGRNMSKGTGVLATIGSISPFVGLFGTVWGIMNSFIGISESQTTNLAVVAPGIAEALLATAIGLVAAIPAVIIYNVFARSVTAYRQALADASAGIERLISRDLDFRKLPAEARNPKIKLVTE